MTFLAKVSLVRSFLVITALIVALFTWKHRGFFFGPAHHETGDFAVNALQIDDSRRFQTLHGNYSRWGFHHPGPALFYGYALGEVLCFRLVPLFPSPHQAHVFAGLVIQALFFAAGIHIVACRNRTGFDAGVVAAILMAYASTIDGLFTSIWPPHALAGPFFAFVCACAVLAVGALEVLPITLLAGAVLVHGHVAQPLFVVPMFCAAYGSAALLSRRRDASWPLRVNLRAHVVAAAILGVFLLPLLIDLAAGSRSNMARILEHFSRHAEEGKRFPQAVGHFLSFFFRDERPELVVDAPGFGFWRYLGQHWTATIFWSAVMVLIVSSLWHRQTDSGGSSAARHRRSLAVFWAAAGLLTLIWGMRQNGEMFAFNSFFVHALVILLLVQAIAPMVERLPVVRVESRSFAALILGALAVVFAPARPVYSQPQTAPEFPQRVRTVLGVGTTKPVLLRFEHRDWPTAAAVALAVQRSGIEFAVDPEWVFMFGERHLATADTGIDRVLRLAPKGPAESGLELTPELNLLSEPAPGG